MKIRKLGVFEETQIICNNQFPFNAVVVLSLINFPHISDIEKALHFLKKRHPLLNAKIVQKGGGYFFDTENSQNIKIRSLDKKNDLHWIDIVENELVSKMDVSKETLHITCLINKDKREGDLIFTFQHSIIDAISINTILDEFLSFCSSKDSFENLNPQKLLLSAECFFPPPFQGLQKKFNNFKFFMRQIWDEVLFTIKSINKTKAIIDFSGKNKVLTNSFSKELTEKILKKARKNRVTINHLFNAAILIAVNKHRYNRVNIPMRSIYFANLRPYLVPPIKEENIGSYFSMMRFTINMKAVQNIWDLAKRIKTNISNSFKKGDKFSANLLSKNMMKTLLRFKSFRMGHTAISFTGKVSLEEKYGDIKVKKLHAFVSNFGIGPEYTAQVRLFNGCFFLGYNLFGL